MSSSAPALPRVLCVDDEPHVLESLRLHLRRRAVVSTAAGGSAALELMAKEESFAVIVSDMRMPLMSGSEFLSRARAAAPHTTRILLTGQADMTSAVAAVNEGQIFRFLTKPCAPQMFVAAVEAAAEQHRLVTAERDLLERTLRGSVEMLGDILALAHPAAFGRASRLKARASELAAALRVEQAWHIEVAAIVSQIGCITLPQESLDKIYYGLPLTNEEQAMVGRLPEIAEQLVAKIPRLDLVRAAISEQSRKFVSPVVPGMGARILRIVTDYDVLEAQGVDAPTALDTMRGRTGCYDPEVLEAFARLRGAAKQSVQIREVPLRAVRVGMVLAEDLRNKAGALVAPRGYEVTESLVMRFRNFTSGSVHEPVRVLVREHDPARVA